MNITKGLLLISFVFLFNFSFGQEKEIRLANEYYFTSDYEKAYVKYEELSKRNQNIPFIYNNYLSTLQNLDKDSEAEKFVRKAVKYFPENILYQLDLCLVMEENGDSKADKFFSGFVDDIKENEEEVVKAYEYLLKRSDPEKARTLLQEARKASERPNNYAINLAKVYMVLDEKEMMIEEMINYVHENPFQIESVKNQLQNYLKEKQDFKLLEDKLYSLVQKEPENLIYNELLLWINLQNKNFRSAFLQAKAIDKRGNLHGSKLLKVGRIALENKEYDAAAKFFQEIVDEYKGSHTYSLGRRLLIQSKEEFVKNTYPIDKEKIYSLIGDYKIMIKEFGNIPQSYEAMRSMAVLYGIYLDEKDSAETLLKKVIDHPRNDQRLRSEAKLNLADIYLLNGAPWEASLLYSQVEKEMEEDQVGHEAKLKNAKLAYYKGEFELAQAHLDILKMATTREIANDAMDLSILIQDNSGLDTSYAALEEYASIDLLLFQNKNDEALTRLDSMLVSFPDHSLTDEIYWLKSKIYRKRGDANLALEEIEKIISSHSTGIFGDDAFFTKGQILEEDLSNREEAMEIYKEFLFQYPGSIYTAEARKRFRLLRGDKI